MWITDNSSPVSFSCRIGVSPRHCAGHVARVDTRNDFQSRDNLTVSISPHPALRCPLLPLDEPTPHLGAEPSIGSVPAGLFASHASLLTRDLRSLAGTTDSSPGNAVLVPFCGPHASVTYASADLLRIPTPALARGHHDGVFFRGVTATRGWRTSGYIVGL